MSERTTEATEKEDTSITEPVFLRIPSRAEYVILTRLMVSQVGEMADLSGEDIYDLKLAVTEAATNAIRHAEVDSFEIEYCAHPGMVEITVNDAGGGFDVDELTDVPNSEGGFGLAVIRNLVDEVTIESTTQGTRLKMTRKSSTQTRSGTG